MSCKKVVVSNESSTNWTYINFRRCSDNYFESQYAIPPLERREINYLDGTLESAFETGYQIDPDGFYVDPSPTPQPSPSVTPTISVTPSVTPNPTTTCTSTPTPTPTPTPTQCLQVGDIALGGIVAYVDNNCHGIIVDIVTSVSGTWGDTGTTLSTSSSLYDGTVNTDLLYSLYSGDPTNIATIAKGLTTSGYTDWVVPTTNDMCEIFINNDLYGLGIGMNQWWSSYEGYVQPADKAFYMQTLSGCPTYSDFKNVTYSFLPVRYF